MSCYLVNFQLGGRGGGREMNREEHKRWERGEGGGIAVRLTLCLPPPPFCPSPHPDLATQMRYLTGSDVPDSPQLNRNSRVLSWISESEDMLFEDTGTATANSEWVMIARQGVLYNCPGQVPILAQAPTPRF